MRNATASRLCALLQKSTQWSVLFSPFVHGDNNPRCLPHWTTRGLQKARSVWLKMGNRALKTPHKIRCPISSLRACVVLSLGFTWYLMLLTESRGSDWETPADTPFSLHWFRIAPKSFYYKEAGILLWSPERSLKRIPRLELQQPLSLSVVVSAVSSPLSLIGRHLQYFNLTASCHDEEVQRRIRWTGAGCAKILMCKSAFEKG